MTALKKAYALNPGDVFNAVYVGHCYYRQKDWAEAADWFRKAICISPRDNSAYWCLAGCYEQRSWFRLAERYYRKAVAIEPTDSIAKRQLKMWLRRKAKGEYLGMED